MTRYLKVILSTCLVMALALSLGHIAAKTHSPLLSRFERSCTALIPPFSVHAQGISVLWSADMESNQSPGPDLWQWYSPASCSVANAGGGLYSTGDATAGPSFDINHTTGGRYSAKLQIGTTSGAVTNGARLFRWLEPQTYADLYYRAWYYFPQAYTPNGTPAFWNVFQWKSKGITEGNNPIFEVNVANRPASDPHPGAMYLYLFDQLTQTSYAPQAYINIPVSGWTQVEAHYVCAADNTGHVTLWQDGTQILDVPNVQTRYSDGDCEWGVNNYSNGLSANSGECRTRHATSIDDSSPRALHSSCDVATIYVDDAAICSGGRCP